MFFFFLSGKYQTLLHCNPNPETTTIEKLDKVYNYYSSGGILRSSAFPA